MFWFHLSACGEMSDPKAGTGYSLRCDPPAYPWKKRLGRRVAFGELQQVPSIKGKENQKFSSACFWASCSLERRLRFTRQFSGGLLTVLVC
ncbi:hypothetical protein [Microcoleus sp. Pol7_B2]|uniref:hypothetical protein n=1 Tax=Microcoleus sp. Pol7_B2 TaxID=2818895 RepID=UPI002FD15C18